MKNFWLKGFVRAEALIAIVIIGLALFAVLLAYLSAAGLARDKQRLTDVGQMNQALQVYFTENGFYPDGVNAAQLTGMDNYLDRWPTAPAADGSCTQVQNEYLYSQKSDGTDFALSFCLGQATDGITAGPHALTSKGIQ